MEFPYPEIVQHLRWSEGVADGWGDVAGSYAEPVPMSVAVVPRSRSGSTEDDEAGLSNRVITDYSLLTPAGVQIGARDRFEVRGQLFEVEGLPFDYQSPFTGWRPGGQVAVRAVTG